MKKKALYILTMACAVVGLLGSCSDDYLQMQAPTTLDEAKLSDPSAAKALMDGIWTAMNVQYYGLEWNQNAGESYVNIFCGEGAAANYITYLYSFVMPTWTYMAQANGYPSAYAWTYYYNIVNLSNYIIKYVPATSEDYEGTDDDMLFYKAQALTMRAHAYSRLMVYFGQRWEDSDNGEAYCFPLRLYPTTDSAPLNTMNEVFDQMYADLDEAIKLYDLSGKSRSNMWEADKCVAYGVYARVAATKHDWSLCQEMCANARSGYSIMGESELFAGFIEDTSETMWSMDPTPYTTYYWSWGSHFACNGYYVYGWQIGAGAINIDLYNKLDENDLRRKFFWTPDKLADISKSYNPAGLDESAFWNENIVTSSDNMNMAAGNVYDRTGKDKVGYGMINALGWWLYDYYENTFTGDRSLIANDDNQYNSFLLSYKQANTTKYPRVGKDANGNAVYAYVLATPFGAQNKFWSIQPYGNMAFPWMRASEFALLEAEAYYKMGNESQAISCLTEVQSKRISGYTCSKSGNDLWEEIMTAKDIELIGEGHAFADLKRWNKERITRKWVAGDMTSGNYSPSCQDLIDYDEAALKLRQSTNYANGWRFAIPNRETRYNNLIDESLLKVIPNE